MTSSGDSQHVHVEGARINRSKVKGPVHAPVTVSVGSDRTSLTSAIQQLVDALQSEGLLADPGMARLVGRLEATADSPTRQLGLIGRIVSQIEDHPALAEAIPATVTAALQAIQLAIA